MPPPCGKVNMAQHVFDERVGRSEERHKNRSEHQRDNPLQITGTFGYCFSPATPQSLDADAVSNHQDKADSSKAPEPSHAAEQRTSPNPAQYMYIYKKSRHANAKREKIEIVNQRKNPSTKHNYCDFNIASPGPHRIDAKSDNSQKQHIHGE